VHNSWKGLIVGGLTGAFVGIALDAFSSAVEKATRGAEHARDRAPEAAEWLQTLTDKAAEWVHDADVPERVREVAHHILESDFAASANSTASKVVEATRSKARSTLSNS
jgi:hypothetical protein